MEPPFEYQHRVLSVERLPQLQEDIDRLKAAGAFSRNAVFQSYTNEFRFALPADFPDARSIIVLAAFVPSVWVDFHLDGVPRPVMMTHTYYDSGLTQAMVRTEIEKTILGASGARLERVQTMFLKLMAVRSGLGRYGRNNICYVGEMGSFVALFAYLTDQVFDEYGWEEIRFLDLCEKCRICLNSCPTGAIRLDEPVVDIEHCITLYNEIEGEFPAWIPPEAHNTLMGCMRCQLPCPANRHAVEHIGRREAVTEEETRLFLSGSLDEATARMIGRKLGLPFLVGSPEMQSLFARNLRVLLGKPTD